MNLKEMRKRCAAELPPPIPTEGVIDDEVFHMIYSSDKSLSDSSLGLVMSGKVRPEVQQYVDNVLLRTPNPNHCDNVDVCLDTIIPSKMQFSNERAVVANAFFDYIKRNKNVE